MGREKAGVGRQRLLLGSKIMIYSLKQAIQKDQYYELKVDPSI